METLPEEPTLHDAILDNDLDLVKTLLSQGADVDSKNPDGETALHISLLLTNSEIVKLLVKSGADVNVKDDKKGFTALQYALEYLDDLTIAEMLIEAGGEVDVDKLSQSTALHFATMHNKSSVIEFLLKSGMDVDLRDSQSRTPIFLAALLNKDGSHLDALETLLKHGADINSECDQGKAADYLVNCEDLLLKYGYEIPERQETIEETSLELENKEIIVDYAGLVEMIREVKEDNVRKVRQLFEVYERKSRELEMKIQEIQDDKNMFIFFILACYIVYILFFT